VTTTSNLNSETSTPETAGRSILLLYLCVFVGGISTLGAEMTASRLLGNVFGTSNIVWANVIGLILLYLSVGYVIGGRWADRSPYPRTFYGIFVWGAFLTALIPLLSRPVLSAAAAAVVGAEASLVVGSFIAIMVLFALPITLLGCVSPFAIRLAIKDTADSGKTSGRIYAISTIGSLIGTFLPVLVLVPMIGTFRTFMVFAALLYIIGFIGLLRVKPRTALLTLWMPVVILVASVLVLNGPLRAAQAGATILFEDESGYNYIQVQEDSAGNRYLYLNEGQGIHSQWHPDQIAFNRTWDFFLVGPYFNNPPYTPNDVDSLAIIGLAGGTVARQYIHAYGDIPIDGIEIDPEIIRAGAEFFDMNEEKMPSLKVYAADGRFMLQQLDTRYSVVGIDAYRPPYIPAHLTTVEYFQEIRAKLTDDGVVVINVGRTPTDRSLVDAMTTTLLQVYPSVHAMDVPYSFNTILVATVQPTTDENLIQNLALLPPDADPILANALTLGASSLVPTNTNDVIFTDDRAPIEPLVDNLVVNFLLEGGAEQLQGGN
jgi:predicted membrane-bound spermidine synthase